MKLEFSQHTFEKPSDIKLHETPSNGSRVVPCWQMNGWTNITKPIVAFRNLMNAPKTGTPREKVLTIFAKYCWRPLQLDALGKRPSRPPLVKTMFLRRCRVYSNVSGLRCRGLRIQGFESSKIRSLRQNKQNTVFKNTHQGVGSRKEDAWRIGPLLVANSTMRTMQPDDVCNVCWQT
jgi:hypothetical protein